MMPKKNPRKEKYQVVSMKERESHYSIEPSHVLLRIVPARNCYRVTGGLSRGNELLNAFLDRTRWLELL